MVVSASHKKVVYKWYIITANWEIIFATYHLFYGNQKQPFLMAHQEYLPGTMQSRSMGAKKHVSCLNIFVESSRDILQPCDLTPRRKTTKTKNIEINQSLLHRSLFRKQHENHDCNMKHPLKFPTLQNNQQQL